MPPPLSTLLEATPPPYASPANQSWRAGYPLLPPSPPPGPAAEQTLRAFSLSPKGSDVTKEWDASASSSSAPSPPEHASQPSGNPLATSTPGGPYAGTRSRMAEEAAARGHFPMLEAIGYGGEITMVFRPWSPQEMEETAKSPPPTENNGVRFATDLRVWILETSPTSTEIRKNALPKLSVAMQRPRTSQRTSGQSCTEPCKLFLM